MTQSAAHGGHEVEPKTARAWEARPVHYQPTPYPQGSYLHGCDSYSSSLVWFARTPLTSSLLSMHESEARRILNSLRSEFEQERAAEEAAKRRAAALQKLIDGYIELFPGLADHAPPPASFNHEEERPRGQEAVRRVMRQSPGKWFTVKLMAGELQRRGWLPDSEQPINAVRTALDRLAEADPHVGKGMGEKTRSVTFRWTQEAVASPNGSIPETVQEVPLAP